MSTQPDFTKLDFDAEFPRIDKPAWTAAAKAQAGKPLEDLVWHTMEKVDVKPLYTKADLADVKHLDFTAGIPPYLP